VTAAHQTAQATQAKPAPAGGLLQRRCACGQHTMAGSECAECRNKREATLQRAAISSPPVGQAPPLVHDVLRTPGQPLDAGTRAFMEPRFGHDFSGVRVHADLRAAESAQAVNALAYTVGRDVVFGAGQYAPGTSAGRRLMAHELTHVVQQRHNESYPAALTISPASDSYEAEAHSLADQVASAGSAITSEPTSSGIRLHRACGPAEIGSQAGCVGRRGDITEFGGDSEKIFRFRADCDTFLPGEKARVRDLVKRSSRDRWLCQ